MTTCNNCGSANADGTKFCSSCGTQLAAATTQTSTPPPLEAWRTDSDFQERATSAGNFGSSTGGYTPPSSPSAYPTYNPPPTGSQYGGRDYPLANNSGAAGSGIHPVVPALVSFFLPGIGLLFVPNKVPLSLGIFGSYIALNVLLFILAVITLGLGTCLFLALPLVNTAAAIHSYDEAAKASGGQYAPLLFKN
jgi:hypothetical protein